MEESNAQHVNSIFLNGSYIIVEVPQAEDITINENDTPDQPQPQTLYVWTFERSDVVSGETLTVIVRAVNWGEAIKKIQNEVRLPELDTAKEVRAAFKLIQCVEDSIYWIGRE